MSSTQMFSHSRPTTLRSLLGASARGSRGAGKAPAAGGRDLELDLAGHGSSAGGSGCGTWSSFGCGAWSGFLALATVGADGADTCPCRPSRSCRVWDVTESRSPGSLPGRSHLRRQFRCGFTPIRALAGR